MGKCGILAGCKIARCRVIIKEECRYNKRGFMSKTKFISATEAAQLLGVDTSTIRRACDKDRLKCKKSGGVWIVDVKSLDDFVKWNAGRKKKK